MNSLYELDPKWQKLLNLDNFLGGLTVNEFVEEISKDHAQNLPSSSDYFQQSTTSSTLDNDTTTRTSGLQLPPPPSSSSAAASSSSNPDLQLQTPSVATPARTTSVNNVNWERLDPKPFIRTFESTLRELKQLNREANGKKRVLEDHVAKQELVHSRSIVSLSRDFDTMTLKFNDLDTQLSTVNQMVTPLSDKLEMAIRRKKNYNRFVELISEYNKFYSQGKSDTIEAMRVSNNWYSRIQAATTVKNLMALAVRVETSLLPRTKETSTLIEQYSEAMENELLESFNLAYRENNFKKLNHIALVLNHLNGGVNVIQNFINQHSYFSRENLLAQDQQKRPLEDEEYKRRLTDPTIHAVSFESYTVNLLNEIEEAVKREYVIVKRVFEDRATYVIQLFVQRVFSQMIEPRVDYLLEVSLKLSNLAYVRMFHALYTLVGQFVKDISDFFQMAESGNLSFPVEKNNDGSSGSGNATKDEQINGKGNLASSDSRVSFLSSLEQCYSDLFSKYLYDRSRYFDIEKRNLESLLVEATSPFHARFDTEVNSKLLQKKFAKVMESGGMFGDAYDDDDDGVDSRIRGGGGANGKNGRVGSLRSKIGYSPRGKFSQFNEFLKNRFDSVDSVSTTGAGIGKAEPESITPMISSAVSSSMATSTSADFSLEMVDSMLKCVVEAVARVMELIPNKSSTYCFELLDLMFDIIVGNYVEVSLDVAYFQIKKLSGGVEGDIDLSMLKYISTSTDILNLISNSTKSIFLPLLNNSPLVKKQVIDLTNNSIKKCEILFNIVLNALAEVCVSCFQASLAKQKRKDFISKSQDLIDQDTLPAIEIVNSLVSIYSQLCAHLRGANLVAVLNRIGENLFDLLLQHYSKFQVSSIGGIIVTKDIIGYQNVIESWNIPNLIDKFATLRELANLFTVQPDLLDSLTKEGHLSSVSREIIQTYISKREDFSHENFITNMKMSFRQYT